MEELEFGADLESEIHQPNTGGHGSRKPSPRLPKGSEYGPHNPRRLQRSQRPLTQNRNRLIKGLQGWWGDVVEYIVFQPSLDN